MKENEKREAYLSAAATKSPSRTVLSQLLAVFMRTLTALKLRWLRLGEKLDKIYRNAEQDFSRRACG